MQKERPHTTVVLAMTADGKISDFRRSLASFGSEADKNHLEQQISLVDGIIFGAGTLRVYGTSLPITNLDLLATRKQQNKLPQPIHIVVSGSGKIDPNLRFFSQPVPRWLLTTHNGKNNWINNHHSAFDNILLTNTKDTLQIDFVDAFRQLKQLGLNKLGILGGGELVASLFKDNLIDELWLTICPLILGGTTSSTPVEGLGFLPEQAKHLNLLNITQIGQEIFLHYQVHF